MYTATSTGAKLGHNAHSARKSSNFKVHTNLIHYKVNGNGKSKGKGKGRGKVEGIGKGKGKD